MRIAACSPTPHYHHTQVLSLSSFFPFISPHTWNLSIIFQLCSAVQQITPKLRNLKQQLIYHLSWFCGSARGSLCSSYAPCGIGSGCFCSCVCVCWVGPGEGVSVKGWNVKDHLSGLSVNWYWLYLGCFCYPSCYHSSSRSPDLFPV